MKVKITFILVFLFLFLGFRVVNAGVIINEVQIKPTGESFIELYNSSDVSQDLTGWSIKRKTASGTEYPLVSQSRIQGKTILPNNYFLLTNEGSYTNSILPDATWATSYNLANDNSIILYNGSEIISKTGWGEVNVSYCDVTCALNPSEGKSIQKTSSGWIIATPTPKKLNEVSPDDSTNTNTSGGSGGNPIISVPIDVKPKVVEIPKIKTKILTSALVYAGIPFEIQASTTGFVNEVRNYGKYFWNFGDGDSKEINLNQNQKFSHTYFYPGEYEITLEYYSNFYSDIPETINRFNIKVISALVTISKVGDEKDFYVELSNDTDYDIDISKWMLVSMNKTFILPKNTSIGTKSKIILSPKVTNLGIVDKDSLKLLEPNSEVAFVFNTSKINTILSESNAKTPANKAISEVSQNTNMKNDTENEKRTETDETKKDLQKDTEEIPILGLSASPILTDVENKNQYKSYFFFWGFVVLLLISGVATYYIRQRKNVSMVGDDFKIIDE
ncbi:MAG: lamin tail domain-containing protein [bacterium]